MINGADQRTITIIVTIAIIIDVVVIRNWAQSRLAAHRARRCEQQAGCMGAGGHRQKMCGGAAWPAGVLPKGGCAGGSS